jgi:hypothetical protein
MALANELGGTLFLLPAIVAPVIVRGFLSLASAKAKPLAGDETAGTITPGKRSAALTVAGGVIMVLFGTVCIFVSVGLAVIIMIFGVAIAGFMAPSLTDVYDVSWTVAGLQGPSRLFGLALATTRTAIRWSEIIKSGITPTGYWYVETSDGRRVYWSYLYPGYRVLTAALRHHCPKLVLPRDM